MFIMSTYFMECNGDLARSVFCWEDIPEGAEMRSFGDHRAFFKVESLGHVAISRQHGHLDDGLILIH